MNRREVDQNNLRVLRRVAASLASNPNSTPEELDAAKRIDASADRIVARLISDD